MYAYSNGGATMSYVKVIVDQTITVDLKQKVTI